MLTKSKKKIGKGKGDYKQLELLYSCTYKSTCFELVFVHKSSSHIIREIDTLDPDQGNSRANRVCSQSIFAANSLLGLLVVNLLGTRAIGWVSFRCSMLHSLHCAPSAPRNLGVASIFHQPTLCLLAFAILIVIFVCIAVWRNER